MTYFARASTMTNSPSQWRTYGRVLLFLFGCAAVLVLTSMLPRARSGPGQELFIGFIASVGAFALTVLFVRWDGIRLREVGAMPGRKIVGRLAIGFMLGLFLVAAHTLLVGLAGHVHWTRTPGIKAEQVGYFLVAYLLLATREELAFHGYPLRRLQDSCGIWPAQAMIAGVFAFEHILGGWSIGQALWGAAIGSLLFGMASIATQGLAVPIGIHAAWNVGDWMRGNRAESGLWRPKIEVGFEAAASRVGIWSYVIVMTLATIGFWCWFRTREAAKARPAH